MRQTLATYQDLGYDAAMETMRMQAARFRSQLNKKVRFFFDDLGYLEVDTPALSPDLIPEATIENFASRFENPFLGSQELYLVPSPEIFMKKLIAEGFGSIYQISHCFRNSEQLGHIHNPEFTMLEYYTMGSDEQDSINLTERLFANLCDETSPIEVRRPFLHLTVEEAMLQYAQVDLRACQDRSSLVKEAKKLGLSIPSEPESWEETFNRIFLTFVEPNLPKDRPVVLDQYPRQISCLAKKDGLYRKRWELYVKGVEIANCYDEERDEATIRGYYQSEYASLVSKRNESGTVIPDIDVDVAQAIASIGQCSGVAIGRDRLQMVLM